MGGDTAKYALDNKLVDELATSTEVEKALTKQFGWSKADNNYRGDQLLRLQREDAV